jgi:hypothetical protein
MDMDASVSKREVLFEGLRDEQILNLPKEEVDQLILLGEPIVFRVGSAILLGSFKADSARLRIELAQIEGGGEGVLMSLASLARRYAIFHGLSRVEWIVHAVSCAKPNLKLRRVLERRGFAIKQIAEVGDAYYLVDSLYVRAFITTAQPPRGQRLKFALSPRRPNQFSSLPAAARHHRRPALSLCCDLCPAALRVEHRNVSSARKLQAF